MDTATATPLEATSPQYHSSPNGSPEHIFHNDPDADIIFRSCDLQDFRVLKLDIIRSSPVLGELIRSSAIDFPDPSTFARAEGPSCIQLPERGDILSSLFTFILPVPPVLPPTTDK